MSLDAYKDPKGLVDLGWIAIGKVAAGEEEVIDDFIRGFTPPKPSIIINCGNIELLGLWI
eukprot:CAMPEP_0175060900 /NCGR_PEP_ID=MMETSP0052_2-20121109/13286_1 /TAXON_ID=51329 ORGANISM="Polytomella parva, Strain SAG 63-3" /NCGR_SAMPLE_ID=MMETSP0052_2 /ASSEMBLY_ACC=CAM_ASM_000194 /LENGTH=59 /DNA_ID=CAMNT_0016326695 /DNA_START=180 /DNA_END=359 /DNA_ORIENTATION=-